MSFIVVSVYGILYLVLLSPCYYLLAYFYRFVAYRRSQVDSTNATDRYTKMIKTEV